MPRFARTIPVAAFVLAGLAGLALSPIATASAQAPTATIVGLVIDAETQHPVIFGSATVGALHGRVDSLGRFTLTMLPPGATHVNFRALGHRSLDTTVTLSASTTTRLDVRLEPITRESVFRAADSLKRLAGVDSSALGLTPRFPVDSPPTSGSARRTPVDSPLTFGAFGARFTDAIVHEGGVDSNTLISPISAAFALSMPLLGARGATAREIADALGVNNVDSASLRRRTAAAMSAGMGRQDVQLEIANAIWVDTAVSLAPTFAAAVATYRATVRSQPLATQEAADSINAWAANTTHGKITKVVDSPFPDSIRLFIANAVYFKGKWLDQFDKSVTQRRDFRLNSGATVQVNGMERTGTVGYRRGDRYQMIRLPYRGGRFAMYVVLPDSAVSAAQVADGFAQRGFPTSLVLKDFDKAHLVLPRMHVAVSYDLKPALGSLGIRAAFDCDDDGIADFSGIAIARHGSERATLCIGKATQAVYFDVDEEGTEAAAVTGLAMEEVVSVAPRPIEFIVDRPFLILLRDEQTGADLFAGLIAHP